MLQTRITKGPWKHVSSSEMSDQINKAFRQLRKYQEADPSDREHLDRPEINIAGIRIRWVHGHDKEVDPEDKIAKANEQCDKIAKEIAEAKPDQSVVASRYISVECMRPTASDPPIRTAYASALTHFDTSPQYNIITPYDGIVTALTP